MLTFLDEHNLITDSQHGFVPAKSCTTNLLETLGIITTALSQNHEVVIVLLDFTKAFNKVSHELLPVKLKALGFENKLIKWVTSFLANRKKRVILDRDKLQSDIDKLVEWSVKWKMCFHEDKCKVMHIKKRKLDTHNMAFSLDTDNPNWG